MPDINPFGIFSNLKDGILRKTRTILALLFLFLIGSFYAGPLGAQNKANQSDFHIETLTIEDGLPFRDVTAIDQDERGMMWFGTTQGLIRYDGYQFKLYNSDQENPFYIPEEAIGVNGIACVDTHMLWYLGHSQLFRLNTKTDHITRYGPEKGIHGNVLSILLDHQNNLWVVTDNYYSNRKASEQAKQFLSKQVAPDSFSLVHEVARTQSDITTLTSGPNQSIWWSTTSQGQLGFSNGGDLIQSLRPDSTDLFGEKLYEGFSFFNSSDEMFFMSSRNEVSKYDHKTKQFQNVHQAEEFFYTAMEDHLGNIWFGSSRYVYLRAPDGIWQDMTQVIRDKLAFGETHQFFLDRQNIVWIATDFGLLKLKAKSQLFDQFLNTNDESLSSPMRGFSEATDGSIVVMNEKERQLYRILPNDDVTSFHLTDDHGKEESSILNAARFFKTDRSHRYAYTANKYMIKIDLLLEDYFVDRSTTPYPRVRSLNPLELLEDGRLVAGHTLATLKVYDPETGASEKLITDTDSIPVVENIRFILESKEPGIIWVGTHENGVFKIQLGGEIIEHLSIHSKPGLSKNAVLVIHEDQDTSLWIGTFGGGVNHYLPKSQEIEYFDSNDGLADNNVVGILPEGDSILWISTYNGLSRFNQKNESFQNFSVEDGLTHNEFNYASYYKDRKGRFYFGGMNGFIRFEPGTRFSNNQYPAPQFTFLTKYDQKANETSTTDLIQNAMDVLTISPNDAYFQIHWTVTSYFDNQANKYYVKMEGLDDDWSFLENRPFIRYNRLDPGRYRLRVRAADHKGNEAKGELSLPIIVRPAFYRTWWFFVLCLVVASAIIYAFFQYRLRQLLTIEKIRTKISSDLHDDLGSMLSGLAMQSELLEMNAREEDKTRLQKITSTSRAAVHRMRDLVWSIDARKDRVSDLIEKMQETAEDLLLAAGFKYSFQLEGFSNQHKKLSVNARQNLYLIFKEALNNIVKHSNGDSVQIQLSQNAEQVQLRIKDNGTKQVYGSKGNSTVQKTGQGLLNMQMRAEHLKGTIQYHDRDGFEIQLHIPSNHIFM